MRTDENLIKARDIMNQLIEGIEPYTGEVVADQEFLNNPKILRSMSYVVNVLTEQIENNKRYTRNRKIPFYITEEEMKSLDIPEGEMGINEFCKAICTSLQLGERKALSGVNLNKKLKQMGILEEQVNDEGRPVTVLPKKSETYGIKTVTKSFQGRPYDQIVYDESGKQFLLDHLQEILEKEA